MNVAIFYFSGTGNTRMTADTYADLFRRAGHQVTTSSMEDCDQVGECDLILIGGPIYAGNMPDYVIQWVRKTVPPSQGTKAIIFTTSAGLANAHGVRSIGKKLVRKGYRVIDTQTYEMPRNFYIDKYAPTPKEEQRQQLTRMVSQVGESLANLKETGEMTFPENVLGIDLLADVFRIMAKSMGHNFHIDDSCVGCGKCEKNCPKANIRHAEKRYGSSCMMCTRCIHGCPVNAISYKGKKIEQYKVGT